MKRKITRTPSAESDVGNKSRYFHGVDFGNSKRRLDLGLKGGAGVFQVKGRCSFPSPLQDVNRSCWLGPTGAQCHWKVGESVGASLSSRNLTGAGERNKSSDRSCGVWGLIAAAQRTKMGHLTIGHGARCTAWCALGVCGRGRLERRDPKG